MVLRKISLQAYLPTRLQSDDDEYILGYVKIKSLLTRSGTDIIHLVPEWEIL